MLGHIPVRARKAHCEVARERRRTPDLRSVKDPQVAVTVGPRNATGQVGATARLGEELHPKLLAAEDGGQVPELLFVAAEVDKCGAEDREGRHVERERHVVGQRLLGEGALMLRAETEPAVARREADAGESAIPQNSLQRPLDVATPVVGAVVNVAGEPGQVVGEPSPRPQPEGLDRFGVVAHRGAPIPRSTAIRSRCSSGVPYRARFTVARRKYRWMSCSHVTPIPPCIWTQSWMISVACGPM